MVETKEKPLTWIGSSREDLCQFPREARRRAGFELRAVQRGDEPSDFKPIPIVGAETYELRLQADDASRVFYIAKFQEAVYVRHAFQKKTQKTSKRDITLGQQRYEAAQQAHRFQQSKAKRPDPARV
ncbi:MAG: type II toxin-antitoxin system RelE/ParE family toxin [Candidatus Binatia bacterium]